VIALGGSSTWALGLPAGQDYPMVMEGLLNEGGGPRFEVLNAAFPAAVATRLLRVLEGGLIAFEPDAVTLCLAYNDAVVLSGSDEESYFARITAADYRRTPVDDLLERWRQDRDRATAKAMFDAFARSEPLPPWPEDRGPPPAERFEHTLRRFAELARSHEFALVLVKEPIAGPWIWKAEMYAAMDRVAADHGLVVVDPTPALTRAGGASLFLDVVHPNAQGHAVIAREVAAGVRRALDGR
jgi:lysophospholipase L1-like esterase